MKKILCAFAALAAMVMAQACQEKVVEETLKAPVLTITPTSVVVDAESDAVAFTASWTSAGEDVNYRLEMAAGDDKSFANPQSIQFPLLEKEFTGSSIAFIAKALGLEGSYSMLFRVTALKNDVDEAVSNVVEVKFTTKTAETPELVEPLLSADKVSVTANPNNKEEAVSISWTSAANDGLTPSYKFEVSTSESFSDKIEIPVAGDALSVSLTGQQIAAMAAEKGLGEEFTAYARIIASAEGAVPVTSNVISVKVKIDYQIPEHLYIYFWEWEDPANAKEMEYQGNGIFTWTGDCGQWEFKFIDTLGEYWTGYFRDGAAEEYWTLKDRSKNSEGDQCMFKLNDLGLPAGKYTVTVNCKTMKVSVEAVAEPLPEHLYLDFWGWGDGTAAKEMDALGNGKFTWSGYITRWQFKFTTSNASPDDYWTGYFRDPNAENYWTLKKSSTEVMFQADDCGLLEGDYTINVDLNTLTVEMVPHIYPIGAFDWGWDMTKAEAMTYEGNGNLSWTGHIGLGDFKFLTQNSNTDDWTAYQRKDGADNYWTAVRCADQGGDLQFNLDSQGMPAGKYKLEFNPFTKAVKVTLIEVDIPATDSPVLLNPGPEPAYIGASLAPAVGDRFYQLADWTHNNSVSPTVDAYPGTPAQIALWAAHAWGCGDIINAKFYQKFKLLPGTYKFVTNTRHSFEDNWVLGSPTGRPQNWVNAWAVATAGSEINSLNGETWLSVPETANLLGSVDLSNNTGTGEVPKANEIEFTLTETTVVSVGVVYSMFSLDFYQWICTWVTDPNQQYPWMDLYIQNFEFYNVNKR